MSATLSQLTARQRHVRDLLAANLGLVRVMFHEAGQKKLCPPIDVIAADITEKWGLRDPADIDAVKDLLWAARPAGTHQVADYNILARVLRRHHHDQDELAHQELLQRQQRTAATQHSTAAVLPIATGSKSHASMVARAPAALRRAASASAVKTAAARDPNAAVGLAAASASKSVGFAVAPKPSDAFTTGTASEWASWLRRYASSDEARSMTYPQFAAAVQAANIESTIGRVDPWLARQHFLSCCTGNPSSVLAATAPISLLSQVSSTAFAGNKSFTSRTSAGTRGALTWSRAPHAADLDAAPHFGQGASGGAEGSTSTPRRQSGSISRGGSATRSQRLRREAIAAEKEYTALKIQSVTTGLPIPLLNVAIPPPPPMPSTSRTSAKPKAPHVEVPRPPLATARPPSGRTRPPAPATTSAAAHA
jgi:hypothetical protein